MDAAGDGANFDAAARSADMGAKGMPVLVFDDDGEVSANFAGDGFGREMEAGGLRYRNFDAARSGFKMPITVARGIAGDFDSAGGAASFYVVVGANNGDGAAGGFRFDAAARAGDVDGAGESVCT